jgi:hypothetical protein
MRPRDPPPLGGREDAAAKLSAAPTLAHADRLIAQGQPLRAYDLTKQLLERYPDDDAVRLRNAHALRRCGALSLALRTLDQLRDATDIDGERRGLRAAVHKELFVGARQRTSAEALEHLRLAQRLYREVFDESQGRKYWHGINAATLALIMGHDSDARDLARRVAAACGEHDDDPADYWLMATRAESALVLGRVADAAGDYRSAVAAAGDRIGDIAAMRHNARLVLDAFRLGAADRASIEDALRPPAVVVFAGLALGRDGSGEARFPTAIAGDVRAEIDRRLDALGAGFGFSGAAPGADLLFIEAMLDRSPGVCNVVLPWPRDQFSRTHVQGAGDAWQNGFDRLLGAGSHPPLVRHQVYATLGVGIDTTLYERFARQLLFGLARLHAQMLSTDVVGLVVWDGPEDDVLDGLLSHWASQGVRVAAENLIDVAPLRARAARPPSSARAAATSSAEPPGVAFRVMAILFADVAGYSKIPEDRLPAFIEHFIGGIAARLKAQSHAPENIRRVGDGLLMVFATVGEAAECALDLVDWLEERARAGSDGETHWSRAGLPREMRMRIALHAGPLFECVDPLTLGVSFEGAHLSYAARIEPITPANHVYASEAFAALAASWPRPSDGFVCEYVGRTSFAKNFGDYPLYHLRRKG